MKTIIKKSVGAALLAFMGVSLTACDDYLDITPPSDVTEPTYLTTADQLGSYLISYYKNNDDVNGSRGSNIFPSHGVGGQSYQTFMDDDQGTDNEGGNPNSSFNAGSGFVKVPQNGGAWDFSTINAMNYFIRNVLPKYENGDIDGDDVSIRHYLGEAYMLRASAYFQKLSALGDFPIITDCQPLDRDVLKLASRRQPRNKVARFILADLDSAINYLSDGSLTGGRTRITKDAAYLFKARVALFEATFEKYFAGTPFVPDRGAQWPGAKMDYLSDFTYDNTAEVNFFLDQALEASKYVAEKHPVLTTNNKQMIGDSNTGMPSNPYYDLWTTPDPSNRDEVLMYRSYIQDVSGGHCHNNYIKGGRGYTQEFANAFLMENGLPIYATNSGYKGDDFVADTKEGRDWRWRLFMKAPNEYVYEGMDQRIGEGKKNKRDAEFKAPALVSGGCDFNTSTGYTKGKGWVTDSEQSKLGFDVSSAVIFRTAEAYLIYMEACWEKKGDGLDALAWELWGKLRVRAGLPQDAHITINATDLDQEERYTQDFGLYSAGRRISSTVLYNIRRERRCELISEGMRWDDLIRWRALDQLKTRPVFTHGCKVWGPMEEWFTHNTKGALTKLLYGQTDPNKNTVSDPNDFEGALLGDPRYFSLQRVSSRSDWYNSGFSWHMAHYLSPIAENHFLQTSNSGNDTETSTIYQNPYWSTAHETSALQ